MLDTYFLLVLCALSFQALDSLIDHLINDSFSYCACVVEKFSDDFRTIFTKNCLVETGLKARKRDYFDKREVISSLNVNSTYRNSTNPVSYKSGYDKSMTKTFRLILKSSSVSDGAVQRAYMYTG